MSHEGIRIVPKDDQDQQEQEAPKFSRAAVTPAKVRVLLTEGKGLEIDWQDGHQSVWSFAWLRDGCPCATCNQERIESGRALGEAKKPDLLQIYTPPAKPASAHPVGRYAVQFNWQDGHSGGIYSWDFLRRNCLCPACRFANTKPQSSGQPN